MAGVLQHLRSSTLDKRPNPASMVDGQVAINYASGSPGMFFKDSNGDLVKVGPVHVGTTAPNVSPASGGTAGNSKGEQWLDTTGGTYVFKIWDGSAWRSETGTFVDVNGDTMTGALGIIAGSASTPGLFFSGDTNTGIYSPGADQLALSTNGIGRLFVDASGRISVANQFTDSSLASNIGGLNVLTAGSSDNNALTFAWNHQNLTTEIEQRIEWLFGDDASANNYKSAGFIGMGKESSWQSDSVRKSYLAFATTNAAVASEKVRITSAGLVGIGTSSPGGSLDVRGLSGTTIIRAVGVDTNGNADAEIFSTGTTGASRLYFSDTAAQSGSIIYSHSANSFSFATNATTAVTIDSSQRVGIGTTSPGNKLDVNGDAALLANGQLKFADATNQQVAIINNGGAANTSQLRFLTGSSPTERARIDSSGRLLVGTSSARSIGNVTAGLEIEGTSYNTSSLSITCNASGADTPTINFGRSKGSSVGSSTGGLAAGDDLGYITFSAADGTDLNSRSAWILCQVDGATSGNDVPGRLVFSVTADGASSPTERFRIGATGRGNIFASDGNVFFVRSSTAAGTTDYAFGVAHSATNTTNGTISFAVFTNGNAVNTNNSYGAISDIKLKENIVDAGSQWDDLKALQVRKYNFKEGQTHTQIGLVAQEVELVSPGLVSESPDRDEDGNDLGTVTKSVNYSVLYMKAVKALQEAMERIEVLEAKVNALEGN